MENHTKYQDTIYSRSLDNNILYVNLYIPSTLNWIGKGMRIIQETRFPHHGSSSLTIHGDGKLKIKLRVPFWVREGFAVAINGEVQDLEVKPGTYATLDRKWRNGDVITVDMLLSLRLERLPDITSIAGIMAGPILLVGKSELEDWIHLSLDPKNLNRTIRPTEKALEFMVRDIPLVPMFKAHNHRYHSYFFIHDSSTHR